MSDFTVIRKQPCFSMEVHSYANGCHWRWGIVPRLCLPDRSARWFWPGRIWM